MIEPLPTSVKPMEKNRRSRSWEIGVLELQREHCPQNTSMRFVQSKNDLFGRIPGLGVAYIFCIAFHASEIPNSKGLGTLGRLRLFQVEMMPCDGSIMLIAVWIKYIHGYTV